MRFGIPSLVAAAALALSAGTAPADDWYGGYHPAPSGFYRGYYGGGIHLGGGQYYGGFRYPTYGYSPLTSGYGSLYQPHHWAHVPRPSAPVVQAPPFTRRSP